MQSITKRFALASSILGLACATTLAQVEVVLSTFNASPTNALPPIEGEPLSGGILVNGNALARLTLSPDGTQWVIGVLTTRGDGSSVSSGAIVAPAAPDYAVIRGTGTTPLATVLRSGIPASYSAFTGSTELDISTTSQSAYRPAILNDGTVSTRTLTSEGTATRAYALSIATDGTKTVMSKTGDVPPTLPSGANDLTIGNIPGVFTSYNSGFVYYNNLNRGATANFGRAVLDYNTSTSALTAKVNNGAPMGSTGSTVYQPLDGSFGSSADGAHFLYVADRSSITDTRAVVVDNEIVVAGGTSLGAATVHGSADIRGAMGPSGAYLTAGFLSGAVAADRKSFLALGKAGGSLEIVAQSGDLVTGSPVANERISGARKLSITTNTQNRLNNTFALSADGDYAYVAGTSIGEDMSVPQGTNIVLTRDVLMHSTAGYLLGVGDEVDLADGISSQPWYLSSFVGDTLSINDEYAYVSVFLRSAVTYNTTGSNYATLSGDTTYAVLAIPIPEPASLGVIGFAAAAVLRRRR